MKGGDGGDGDGDEIEYVVVVPPRSPRHAASKVLLLFRPLRLSAFSTFPRDRGDSHSRSWQYARGAAQER